MILPITSGDSEEKVNVTDRGVLQLQLMVVLYIYSIGIFSCISYI